MRDQQSWSNGPACVVVAWCLTLCCAAACAGPPWYMGSPRSGKPSISAGSELPSRSELRRQAALEAQRCRTARELRAYQRLASIAELNPTERRRFACLLAHRAADFGARGRAIPMSGDLRLAAELDASRRLSAEQMALVERAAADAWLALGEPARAEPALARAAALGAADLRVRQALVARRSLDGVSDEELQRALRELPDWALPALAEEYLSREGDDSALLERARLAAHAARRGTLEARLRLRLQELGADGSSGTTSPGLEGLHPVPVLPLPEPGCARCEREPEDGTSWLLGGPTVASRVLPAVRRDAGVLDGAEARQLAELLTAEDPTSPEAWEVAAMVDARAKRVGAVEEDLRNLVYATPERARALRVAATVWERAGQQRRACAAWLRAAEWTGDAEDSAWAAVVSCTRRDPGAGDWREIRRHVLELAKPERRAAVQATLDSASAGADAGQAPLAR